MDSRCHDHPFGDRDHSILRWDGTDLVLLVEFVKNGLADLALHGDGIGSDGLDLKLLLADDQLAAGAR